MKNLIKLFFVTLLFTGALTSCDQNDEVDQLIIDDVQLDATIEDTGGGYGGDPVGEG